MRQCRGGPPLRPSRTRGPTDQVRKVSTAWTETPTRESVARRARERQTGRPRSAVQPAIGLFYRQVVAELRKVIWPTRKELITYTTVVIVFVLMVIALRLRRSTSGSAKPCSGSSADCS